MLFVHLPIEFAIRKRRLAKGIPKVSNELLPATITQGVEHSKGDLSLKHAITGIVQIMESYTKTL